MYGNWLIAVLLFAAGTGLAIFTYAIFTPFVGIPVFLVVLALVVRMFRGKGPEATPEADRLETEKLNRPDRPDAGEARPSH